MKGVIWHMETEGMTFDEVPVPEDMLEEAYREISSSTSKQVSGIMQHLLNVVIYIECM